MKFLVGLVHGCSYEIGFLYLLSWHEANLFCSSWFQRELSDAFLDENLESFLQIMS